MNWRLRFLGAVMAAVLAACTGDGQHASTTAVDPIFTSTTGAKSAATTVNESTSTTMPPDPTKLVTVAWERFWLAWAQVRASEDLDPGPFEAVATQDVIDDLVALLDRQAETSGPVATEIATSPVVAVDSESAATVQDCVLMSPSITDNTGISYEAEFEHDGSGWRVASLGLKTSGCVPREMAAEAVAAYEAYYRSIPEFWNPPDPDHPILEEVLTDPRLSSMRELLAEHEERGVIYQSDPKTHPEVIEVRSATELVILDCYEPGADDGLYDLESGEQLADEPEVRLGQRNLRSAVMVFEDGVWKASDFQGQVDFACEFAPTDRGLPSV